MISAPEVDKKTPARFLTRMQHIFSSRAVPPAVAVLALLLSLPTVRLGFMWDDLMHRTMMRSAVDSTHTAENPWQLAGRPPTPGQLMLNLFCRVDPALNPHLRDLGLAPWWTYDNVKIVSFRPLSALTHWLDFKVWGDRPEPMHLESIVLYALVCFLAALLFFRLESPGWVAGLAALIFAVDGRHISDAGWLASRNSLLALAFGLLALISHDRWRREQWKPGLVLAPGCLALAAASAEIGVATGAYLLAHIVFLDKGNWRRRIVLLLPYVAVGVVWCYFDLTLDFGAYGTGLYIDPGREPLRFIKALAQRWPVMVGAQIVGTNPLPYFYVSAPMRVAYWMVTVALLFLIGRWMWQLLRGDGRAGFWGLGMLLSAVLVSGLSMSTGRPLVFVGIGGAALVAKVLWKILEKSDPLFQRRIWRRAARAIGVWFLILHLIISPAMYVMLLLTDVPPLVSLDAVMNFSAVQMNQDQDLVVVNQPNTLAALYFVSLRQYRQEPIPAHVRILAPAYVPVTMARVDSSTVTMRPWGGYLVVPGSTLGDPEGRLPWQHPAYFFQGLDETYRSREHPMHLHDRVVVTGMRVEVTAMTDDGRPAEVQIRFAEALESRRWSWVMWDWSRRKFIPFTPPAVGSHVTIAGPPPDMSMMAELLKWRWATGGNAQ